MKQYPALIISISLIVLTMLTPSHSAVEPMSVTVMFDFGDGIHSAMTIQCEANHTAFNATQKACDGLEYNFTYTDFGWGILVNSINDYHGNWPGSNWVFKVWNATSGRWDSLGGASDINCTDGLVIVWTYAFGWPGTTTLLTPDNTDPVTSFRVDNHNTGVSHSTSGNDPIFVKDLAGAEVASTVATAGDRIYLTTWDHSSTPNGLLCLNSKNGTTEWSQSISSLSSPALYGENLVVGDTGGYLRCFWLENGTEFWSLKIADEPGSVGITTSPKIEEDIIYIGTYNYSGGAGKYYAISIQGTIIWEVEVPSSVYFSSAAIGSDRIFFGLMGKYNSTSLKWQNPYGLCCLNKLDGKILWNRTTNNSVASSPSIQGRNIYFTCKNGHLYSLDIWGNINWKKKVMNSTSSPAVIGNKIIVGYGLVSQKGGVICIDSEGNMIWNTTLNGGVQSSPIVNSEYVYVTTNVQHGKLYCLNLTTGNIVWDFTPTPNNYILSSPILSNDRLYFGCDNGKLYCLGYRDPEADFSFNSTGNGLTIYFQGIGTDGGGAIISWQWEFGDGNTSTNKNPVHKYARPGNYTVTLTIVDDEGTTAIFSTEITFSSEITGVEKTKSDTWLPAVIILAIIVIILLVIGLRRRKHAP